MLLVMCALVRLWGNECFFLGKNKFFEDYASDGVLLKRTLATGGVVSYGRSTVGTPKSVAPTTGLLVSQNDQFGRFIQFIYDDNGLLTQVVDPNGNVYAYAYDTSSLDCVSRKCDRVTQVQVPDGFVRKYRYDDPAYVDGLTSL